LSTCSTSVCRVLHAPADPLLVAEGLADRPGLAVLASRPQGALRTEDARWSFVACDPVEACADLVPPPPGPVVRWGPGWDGATPAPRWIGVVPYDAIRSLERASWTPGADLRPAPPLVRPAWRRYDAVVRIDHATGRVVVEADDPAAAERLSRAVLRSPRDRARSLRVFALDEDEQDGEAHRARIRAALALIAAGDIYEINLARRISLAVRGSPLDLFTALLASAPAPWGFLQDLGDSFVCGVSPELALSVRGDRLRTCPIKGTRPRGRDAAEDARLAAALDADPKERAELVMAVDVHRSDLGRVAAAGSVHVHRPPRLVRGPTVWSRVAEVVARRAPGATLEDVVRAVLPCGSVTGAPKVRAMEVIAQLEPWRRGAYTGAFGYVSRGGELELAMAIRTIQGEHLARERDGRAWYFAGGGIVWGSDPDRELEETRWKSAQLAALGSG
jgi:anthranilate/para-aminobenzoate synthase component I